MHSTMPTELSPDPTRIRPMRLVGAAFMALGLLLGMALSAFLLLGGAAFGLTWILSVAVAKLAFLAAIGLIGAGAVLRRIDGRRTDRTLTATVETDSHAS